VVKIGLGKVIGSAVGAGVLIGVTNNAFTKVGGGCPMKRKKGRRKKKR